MLAALHSYGQLPDAHVQLLVEKAGLIQPNQAEDIMRDSKGFLWLLTPSKIQRFDGKNVLSFAFDDRLLSIQEDHTGTIWLAGRQNVFRFTNIHTRFENVPGLSSNQAKFRAILAGPEKRIYLLTTEGILRWNDTTEKMEPIGIKPFKSAGNFAFLKSFDNWLFYRADNKVLVRYNIITRASDSLTVLEADHLFPLNADSVWVRQSIGATALGSFVTKTVVPIVEDQFTETFTDKRFFITGGFTGMTGDFFAVLDDKGYYRYSAAENRFKKMNLFYNGRPILGKPLYGVRNYCREANGVVWLANEEGFIYFNATTDGPGLLRSKTNEAGSQWNNDVRNFAEDDMGNIWFGTANGFCKWEKATGKVINWTPRFGSQTYLNYPSVKSMGLSNGKIIVGQSEWGFWIFDPLRESFARPVFESDSIKVKFESSFNHNMLRLRNGNFLILCQGLWLMDGKSFMIKPIKASTTSRSSRKAIEDEQGRIWLVGPDGISVLDKDFQELYYLQDKVRGRWFNAILQIDEQTFWVAAKTIYEVKLQAGKQLSIRPILPEYSNVHFSNLFKDSLNRIWLCHEDGIFLYDPNSKRTLKLDQDDNVPNFYAGVSNSFRGRDGVVYFGSMNGITYFTPEKISFQNEQLQVHMLNVTINHDDSSWMLQRPLHSLRYDQNAVVFDFVATYLYSPDKVQYRYQLEGADTNWIDLGHNASVFFNSLQPGKYRFHAAASVNGTDWYAMETPYSFVINPPFWKSWWFTSILFVVIGVVLMLFIKRRIRLVKEREAAKTAMQQLKAAGYREQLEIEQIINHFATSMNSITSIGELAWDVAKNCISKLNFEDCVIYLKDENRNILIQKAAWGPKTTEENKIINPIEILPGMGIVGHVAMTGKAEIISDTSQDDRYIVDDIYRLSEITVPIINNGKVLGVIDSEHTQKDFYTKRHLQILETIASLCAGKIDTIKAAQQIREKEMELLRLHKDVATSQLTTLRMQMNPHFIFNALNSVQHFILQGNVVEANKYLSRFSKLQREILHCSNQQFITLEKEIEVLSSYLQLEQFRFGEGFVYEINMTNEIEPVEIKIPPMMLQPFVENAIWHGLMPLKTQRQLTIHFDLYTDDILLATIRDNGIGRDASARLKQTNGSLKKEHESKGMGIVQQRLQLLQQQYDKPFDATITDITDVNGMVQGTQVTLKIFIGNTKS
ncbi:MAG: histidine kinase [Bacteroidota bacterium]